jgi:hypothetical protein
MGMIFALIGCLLLNAVHCQGIAGHEDRQSSVAMEKDRNIPFQQSTEADQTAACDNLCHSCSFLPVQPETFSNYLKLVLSRRVIDENCPDGLAKAIDHPPQLA